MDWFIVVAGGHGERMGKTLPKQFIDIGGQPVLIHTIERLHRSMPQAHFVLVLPVQYQSYWIDICKKYDFRQRMLIADGGETRFQSVRNGLALITESANDIVAVHDGVRPFVDEEVVRKCFERALQSGAALPVVQPVESVRFREGEHDSHALERARCCLVQTPQVFRLDWLRRAYTQEYRREFTDDASVVESCGYKIDLVEGNRENIKLTTPADLQWAEVLLEKGYRTK